MKKKLLAMLLAAVMVTALLPTAFAADTSGSCGDSVTWSYSGGVLTISGTGAMAGLTNDTPEWTQPWKDYCKEIKTVVIEDGVTSIGGTAFEDCSSLTSVTIPASVITIGWHAFANCGSLTSVDIPVSVTTIEWGAFDKCSKLTSVSIPDGVSKIEAMTFASCDSLTSVDIPASITTVEQYAFVNCNKLTDVSYGGDESQWKSISVDNAYGGNDPLLKAKIHYTDTSEPTEPETPEPTEPEPTEPEAPTFTDVTPGIWYEEAVQYVSERGLMGSTGGGKFSPDETTTRGMIATILARMNGEDTNGGSTWYEKGMAWAKANGVSDGANPTGDISREQMAVMLYRDAGSPSVDVSVLDRYPDSADVDSWAVNGMAWAVANGVVTGSGGKLNPTGTATRAEAATMLMRYCEKFGK